MIAPSPTVPSTSSSRLEQTRAMAALLKRYLYPQTATGPGKSETIAYIAPAQVKNEKRPTLGQRLLSHTAGLLVLYTYALVILVNGGWKFGFNSSERDRKRRLAASRASLWSLSKEPYTGVKHRFYTDEDTGIRMHYVETGDTTQGSELVILLHGFPDSYYSWRHQLTCSHLRNAHLIAADLPGFGGSDSLPDYGPGNVLSTVVKFVLAMKMRKTHGRCVLVGHDWGSVVVCRLASECPKGTFSRVIIVSGMHPTLLKSNVKHNIESFSRTAKSTIFMHHPLQVLFSPGRARRDLARLAKSWNKNISPILSQARHSHYIFPMRFPWMVVARRLPVMAGYWFLRQVSRMARCSDECSYLANALGPSIEECLGGGEDYRYPTSVRQRKGCELDSMISYYRDGLGFYTWEENHKPLPLREGQKSPRGSGQYKSYKEEAKVRGTSEGRFKCPAIVIWGSKDPFYTPELVQTGWGKMFCYDAEQSASATIVLKRSGHWVHVGGRGREVVNGLLEWCVKEGEIVDSESGRSTGGEEEVGPWCGERKGNEKGTGRIRELKRLVGRWYRGDEEAVVTCY
ncbi:Alpha/Beta hydrolase protein [Kalaharituber pfeilii]|nr:Alpha/Beta hydrolase protein [Kalaharituber pfeilii]